MIPDLVPMRWPAEWREPAMLDLLQDTPVNCLVVDSAADAVLAEARKRGLALATIAGNGSAQAAGITPVRTTDGVWPGIQWSSAQSAGPTGAPWVDSNGWRVRLARARAHEGAPWVTADPPKDQDFIRSANYALAIADTYAYGGRWVVSLDAKLRAGLAARGEIALDFWKAIAGSLSFFHAHRNWAQFEPVAPMAVVSSFSGPDEDFASEILNLLARRGAAYRVLLKEYAEGASLEALRAIVYADAEPPAPGLAKKLDAFARSGGMLIAGSKFRVGEGTPAGTDVYGRYHLHAVGKGRIAVARDESPDPFIVAGDAQLLLSHRYDPVRFFNAGTLVSYLTVSADGNRAVLNIVNFALRQFGHPVSIAFPRAYRSARMWTLGAAGPKPLETHPAEDGIELHLPAFGVFAAIELEA